MATAQSPQNFRSGVSSNNLVIYIVDSLILAIYKAGGEGAYKLKAGWLSCYKLYVWVRGSRLFSARLHYEIHSSKTDGRCELVGVGASMRKKLKAR